MEHYEKPKKKKLHFPSEERKIWNCTTENGITSDVLGSYSGTDTDGDEPVQDADDL